MIRGVGKGANSLISCLDHFFENVLKYYPQEICFYFDNCTGENKNNTVL